MPLASLGTARSRRLLIAGCMLSDDRRYDASAEVHVPQACERPRDPPRPGHTVATAYGLTATHALQLPKMAGAMNPRSGLKAAGASDGDRRTTGKYLNGARGGPLTLVVV